MRWIKSYKLFESSDVDNDIIEICYELTDDKFSVKIYDTSTGWGSIPHTGFNPPLRDEADKILFISLSDYRDYNGFSFNEVREVVLRIIDYLGDKYKGCSILSVGDSERISINKEEVTGNKWASKRLYSCNLTNLVIIYK